MKKYYLSMRVWEQAERMADKLAIYKIELFEKFREAEISETEFDRLNDKLNKDSDRLQSALMQISGCGTPQAPWWAIQILKEFASQRDVLDCSL